MVKEALVVKRDTLFAGKYFEGFLPLNEHNFIPLILSNHFYHPRGDELENNESLQQIIPYVWIVNLETKQVFAYQRSAGKNYSEKRLQNKISCGIGGHIENQTEGKVADPITHAMMRELKEEVSISEYPTPKIVGYINDDSDSVGRVHFGVVAIAETTLPVQKGDEEMKSGKFYTLDELEKTFKDPQNEVERWTTLSWPIIKAHLLKSN